MSIERTPELGSKPVALTVKLPAVKGLGTDDHLGEGLRELYRKGEFTDVALVCAERTFYAHRIVLAAKSAVLKETLGGPAGGGAAGGTNGADAGATHELRLADIANPEAVTFMLDFMYQMDSPSGKEYNPRTLEVNKDVLRLAHSFRLPGLTERATQWLARDLTTGNVVERLTICEDFGLQALSEKILEQLTYNKRALAEVASSPEIMRYPKLMQALLQKAAAVREDSPQPKKKMRKT